MRTALLGYPVSLSPSPTVFAQLARAHNVPDYAHLLIEVRTETAFRDALARLETDHCAGVNVTLPWKQLALTCCDTVSAVARATQAVNTIIFKRRGGRRWRHGTNTDVDGVLHALSTAGIATRSGHRMLLGTGGAARAVAHRMREAGLHITAFHRVPDSPRTEIFRSLFPSAHLCADLGAVDVATLDGVCNATPIGMAATDLPLVPDDIMTHVAPRGGWCLECVIRDTALADLATRQHVALATGRRMLEGQAAVAFTAWLEAHDGESPPPPF